MTRWFKLVQSATYSWKSKVTGKGYHFVADKAVAVEEVRDHERFENQPDQFVEVDERGNILDQVAGTAQHAFSRKGMVQQPRSYSKVGKKPTPAAVVIPTPEPPKPSAPRTVVSSNKTEPPAEDKVKAESEKASEVDASSESPPLEDSAPKKVKKSKKASKKSKKSKKLGRTDNN